MATSDVNRFIRFWHEISFNKIGFNYTDLNETENGVHKWFPYINGGPYRKWYGNNASVVNWEFNGKEVKEYAASLYKQYTRTIKNIDYYLKECISWGMITSGDSSFRYYSKGFIFDIAGCCLFPKGNNYSYMIGFLNTRVSKILTNAINPTINMNVGDIANLPVLFEEQKNETIKRIVENCICISKRDWDSFETSWDFKKHPLV